MREVVMIDYVPVDRKYVKTGKMEPLTGIQHSRRPETSHPYILDQLINEDPEAEEWGC